MNEYLIGHFLYKKGRVGRELFEFEELWFSFSWSHFVFSHPNSLIPPWGKEQATLVELWPLKPKDMSTHLTLSGGTWKPAVAETFNRTWRFSPDKSLKKKKVIAARSTLSRVRTFSLMLLLVFNFRICKFDWRAKTISDGKFGVSDSTTWFLILCGLHHMILTIVLYMCFK